MEEMTPPPIVVTTLVQKPSLEVKYSKKQQLYIMECLPGYFYYILNHESFWGYDLSTGECVSISS